MQLASSPSTEEKQMRKLQGQIETTQGLHRMVKTLGLIELVLKIDTAISAEAATHASVCQEAPDSARKRCTTALLSHPLSKNGTYFNKNVIVS